MKEAFKVLADWQKEGRYSVTGYISDQVPGFSSMHYWPWFLNTQVLSALPASSILLSITSILNVPAAVTMS